MEKKWYYSKWFIILSLVYLMPLGLFLMWEGKIFTKKTRIVISTIIAIISALLFITSVNTKPLTPEQEKSRIEYEQAQREARKAKEEQAHQAGRQREAAHRAFAGEAAGSCHAGAGHPQKSGTAAGRKCRGLSLRCNYLVSGD